MRTFMVVGHPTTQEPALKDLLTRHYGNAMRSIRPGVWLIRSADSTTKDVSDRLGFTPDGASGLGVVLGLNGYFGRWEPDLWEWLQASQVAGGG